MSKDQNVQLQNIEKMLFSLLLPFREFYYGVKYQTYPWEKLLVISATIAFALTLEVDRMFLSFFDYEYLYPYHEILYWTYFTVAVFLPIYCWSAYQAVISTKVSRRLKECFQVAGLVNRLGRAPSLISNIPVDSVTKKLKVTSAHLPIVKFKEAQPFLESSLNVFIDEMKEIRERGIVEIVYSPFPMPELVPYGPGEDSRTLDFWVGNTRANRKLANFRDVPHLMVAGQTGGGKSTFVRQLITHLYTRNKSAQFLLIDLKGGLEFSLFENYRGIKVVPSVENAIKEFAHIEKLIQIRMKLLKESNCKDIDAFIKKFAEPTADEKVVPLASPRSRHFVVVDEAAEMFLASDSRKTVDVQTAKRVVSLIARQGRAVGVHLVIATQRPDSKALDPQVKANLTGVLCFQMVNDASSITVLGNGRATDLPPIPGRAIWKNGIELVEVQTPFMSIEAAEKILAAHKEDQSKVHK